jgi:hypothetical protein
MTKDDDKNPPPAVESRNESGGNEVEEVKTYQEAEAATKAAEEERTSNNDSASNTVTAPGASISATNGNRQKEPKGITRGLRRNEEEWEAKRKALQERRMAKAALETPGSAASEPGAIPSNNQAPAETFVGRWLASTSTPSAMVKPALETPGSSASEPGAIPSNPTTAETTVGRWLASTSTPSVMTHKATPAKQPPSLVRSSENNLPQHTPPPMDLASATADDLDGTPPDAFRHTDSVVPAERADPVEQSIATEENLMTATNARDFSTASGNVLNSTFTAQELIEAQPVMLSQAQEVDPERLQRGEEKKRREWCFKRMAAAIIAVSILVIIITVAVTQTKKDVRLESTQIPTSSSPLFRGRAR